MIEIKNLSKSFGTAKVLDKINLSVKQGEILGFLGPNGAGKSTTMKIATTFWSPDDGQVLIDGLDVTEYPMEVKRKIGYLPETVPLYDDMLVYEYLRFVAEVRCLSKQDVKRRISEVVEATGLGKVLEKPIDELSKGYRQRVGLAQAIMHEPDILILDEPTTGLDPNQIAEIRELIKKIGREKTVIFSTHILAEVSAVCDRVVIINNGRIVGEGRPQDLIKQASADSVVQVKLRGPREAVLEKIRSLSGVASADVSSDEAGLLTLDVRHLAGADVRGELAKVIVESGWEMQAISTKEASLEDVFKTLTK